MESPSLWQSRCSATSQVSVCATTRVLSRFCCSGSLALDLYVAVANIDYHRDGNWESVWGSPTGPQFSNGSGSNPPVGPVYELRIYSIKPDKFATFRQLMAEKFHLRLAYSLPLGYWIADLGGIFQAVHIWPYDSVSQRAQIRQAMGVDKEWQEGFFTKFLPCTLKLDNALMVMSPDCAALHTDFQPSPAAAYELLSLPLQTGGGEKERTSPPTPVSSDKEILVGSFRTVYGDVNTEYRLMRYPDADTAFVHARKRAQENPQMSGYSRFMVPHECSPIK